MSITYYRVDADTPGMAAARLPGVNYHVVNVDTSSDHPGELVVQIVEPGSEVGAQVAFGGDDPEGTLAFLAVQLVEWLREKRPHHECHEMLEGLLGIYPPEAFNREDDA